MTDLRLISEPPLDDLDLRVSLESRLDSALMFADEHMEAVDEGDFVRAAAARVAYLPMRADIRRLRALMRAEHS